MKLLVYKETHFIQEIHLEQGTIYNIGRKEDCHIVLEKLPGISRKHFEIVQNDSGTWKVNVLSKMMPVRFEGKDQKEFLMDGKGEFLLRPYRFVFQESKIEPDVHYDSDPLSSAGMKEHSLVQKPPPPFGNNREKSFHGDNERTFIQKFNGIPYIKIIGKSARKSEYFRLEGNLWVIGNSETASVFLRESIAISNHFEISKTDRGFFITDSGSPHGTELNGQKLASGKPHHLISGDIISVGRTSMQFELRDKAFEKKVVEIPNAVYKNPLVFFDKDVVMEGGEEEEEGPGKAERLQTQIQNQHRPGKKRRKFIMTLVAGILLAMAVSSELLKEDTKDEKIKMVSNDPIHQLPLAKQKIVRQTYNLAKQLYLEGKLELAMSQLDRLHFIIPSYKDSREMENNCINSRELKEQQATIEKEKREQQALEQRVQSVIAQCYQKYGQSFDIDGVKACLTPAASLDPNNAHIAQILSEMAVRVEQKELQEKIAMEEADRVRRGKELYEKARGLHSRNDYLKAMEAYENHIHSGLPDPRSLVRRSRRYLASIEKMIKTKKTKLVRQAQSRYKSTQLKDAIYLARRAQKVDPYDPQISNFLFKMEKELYTSMKNIYMDSVIEERFGNLEASRTKWEAILKFDIKGGEYYKKAKRKLKIYGFGS